MTANETPALIQQDLYFEQNANSEARQDFQAFVDDVISPRFPAGLTVFNDNRQNTTLVSLFVEDTPKSKDAIAKIIEIYNARFSGVTQVTNKDDLKVGFGGDEDLINSDRVPESIQVDLYFGRNIANGGEVSKTEFAAFVDNVITPRFPAGLTVFEAKGKFQDSTGKIIAEPAEVVSLILEDTEKNEVAIHEIVKEYIQKFQQESVLQAVNEDITVSFGVADNLIDNDSVPELIQVDLYFGRNIAGGGVSPARFQTFVDNAITPRFPELSVFDAEGQFQDSKGKIIEEPSQMVSLVFKDTELNEAYINQIVKEYIQQFQQESVLVVVDEDIQTNVMPTENASCFPSLQDIFTAGYVGILPTWEANDHGLTTHIPIFSDPLIG